MGARFLNKGFAFNPNSADVFKDMGNSIHVEGAESAANCRADTTLRLDFHDSSIPDVLLVSKGIKRKRSLFGGLLDQKIGLPFCLWLGHSSSSSDSKGSSATHCTTNSYAKETDEESSMDLELDFSLHLGGNNKVMPKNSASSNVTVVDASKVDLELSLSFGPAESDIMTVQQLFIPPNNVKIPVISGGAYHQDEGSTPSQWERGKSFSPPQHSPETSFFLNQPLRELKPASKTSNLSSSIIIAPKSSVTCTSGITRHQQHRNSCTKICQFMGCGKGARGASGLCIAHGGGRRCQKPGCHKGAEGRTVFCKVHGGGRRCEFLGCTKSAEGCTDYCIAHGGGRRCSQDGCTHAARGKSGLCIRHGGGKRCTMENCTKSAEGLSGLCISHGGGCRCQYLECSKGSQGSTMFCKAHGGGKRCTYEGCTKGAEGSTSFCKGHGGGKRCAFEGGGLCPKSVHGGTLFCVAHGGGKRCVVHECKKSARGRTDYCVCHGGGKRCKFEGCTKSAQGRMDLCKAHGGGKRCSWGQPGSVFGQDDFPCNSFVRGKTGLCTCHDGLVQDKRVHGGATVGVIVQDSKPSEEMKEVVGMGVDVMMMDNSVVTTVGHVGSAWRSLGPQEGGQTVGQILPSVPVAVLDGRVHGGSLIALLAAGKSANTVSKGSKSIFGNQPEPGKLYMIPQN